jgi:hypothetical protein
LNDSFRHIRQLLSASKASAQFLEHGRGVMFARISKDRDSTPELNDRDTYVYRNTYVPIADLNDDADRDILRLVKQYDPATQAVVAIEYEPGCRLEPEVIQIRGGHLKDTISH